MRSEEEKHVTVTDSSPPSSFSLSPQSGRSYRTPSPAGDFGSYSDYSWADPEPRPIPTAQPNRSFPAEPLVVLTKSDSGKNDNHSVESHEEEEEEERERENDNEKRVSEEEEEEEREKAGPGSVNRRKLKPDLTRTSTRKSTHDVAKRALLGLRVFGFCLCLISFAVMASDRDQGWALDSFYRYKEFRYCFGVNLLGFVYSGFQVLDLIHFVTTRKHLVQHRFRYYSDFFIDQAIAYLLMSASSSASTRVYDWQSNWGKDKFPDTAHVSVGFSFAAFASLALTSLISGYMLCTAKSF